MEDVQIKVKSIGKDYVFPTTNGKLSKQRANNINKLIAINLKRIKIGNTICINNPTRYRLRLNVGQQLICTYAIEDLGIYNIPYKKQPIIAILCIAQNGMLFIDICQYRPINKYTILQ